LLGKVKYSDSSIQTNSFHLLSVLKLRVCSEGHAQLKPSLDFHSSIALNSYARYASPTLEVQEYVEKMCSLEHYSIQSCWRVQNGMDHCNGHQRNYQIWMTLPSMLIFEPEAANDFNANGIISLNFTWSNGIGWDFPATLYPLGTASMGNCVHYRLIARIFSVTATGYHFMTTVRTTDDFVYTVNGMYKHSDIGIKSISKFEGRGSALRLNKPKKHKDLSAITGRQKNTVAVFYILEEPSTEPTTQTYFWRHQQAKVGYAVDIGPILLAPKLNQLKLGSSSYHTLNNWIPCTETDITWTEDLSKLHWEFKVMQNSFN
jgi:hypothetical protein